MNSHGLKSGNAIWVENAAKRRYSVVFAAFIPTV